jgi:hypothetical protein
MHRRDASAAQRSDARRAKSEETFDAVGESHPSSPVILSEAKNLSPPDGTPAGRDPSLRSG